MGAIQLYPHNQTAFENLCAMLQKERRGAVIQPTGTGKSFIALALITKNPKSTFLYLAPSVYIFRQLLRHAEDELGNTCMLTYQKLCQMSEEELSELAPDYIILDEFHRCGADEWGSAVYSLLSHAKNAMLVGFTATPIRYLDRIGVRNMAEELFGKCVAHYYSLRQAIADHILSAPKYVLCDILIDDKLKAREAALRYFMRSGREYGTAAQLLEDMRRNLAQADGVEEIFGKYLPHRHAKLIVFCRNLNHIQQAQSDMRHWLREIGPMRCYSCRSDDGVADAELLAFIQDTAEDALRLLFCVDMLNEGLHVGDLDGVVMLRPTVSPTVYLQQIGRCLAAGPGKNSCPVIFDLVNNHRSAKIERNDDILLQIGGWSVSSSCRSDRSTYPFALGACETQFETLLEKFDHILSRNGRWEYLFSILQDYVQQYGAYPKHRETCQGVAIGYWLFHQVDAFRIGTLPASRADALSSLPGWDDYVQNRHKLNKKRYGNQNQYESQRKRWYQSLHRLEEYLQSHNGNYPTSCEGSIYFWCYHYAKLYRSGQLPSDIKTALERLPLWDEYIKRNQNCSNQHRERQLSLPLAAKLLAQYTAEHNGKNPSEHEIVAGYRLGKRVNAYRVQRKQNKLSAKAQQMLEEAGIIWVVHEKSKPRSFEEYYEELSRYHAKEGHIVVPQSYVTPDTKCKLGVFIQRMRLAYKGYRGYHITPEQIQMLNALGMVWSVPQRSKTSNQIKEVR